MQTDPDNEARNFVLKYYPKAVVEPSLNNTTYRIFVPGGTGYLCGSCKSYTKAWKKSAENIVANKIVEDRLR